jgi:hypothetical protein
MRSSSADEVAKAAPQLALRAVESAPAVDPENAQHAVNRAWQNSSHAGPAPGQ